MRYIIGLDEVGRAALKRASPKTKFIIGIDEVGRGSLAGPVAVSAVCVPRAFRVGARTQNIGVLRDSKKLSPIQRRAWFEYFRSHKKVRYAVARVYSKTVDAINISRAANRAAGRAFQRLLAGHDINLKKCTVFLDGGLYLGNKRGTTQTTRGTTQKILRSSALAPLDAELSHGVNPRLFATTVVRGDEKITAIKIASIIAKVSRDREMEKLSKKFPGYAFERHKGYGTRRHIAAIRKLGPSSVHRLTFLKNLKLKTESLKVMSS